MKHLFLCLILYQNARNISFNDSIQFVGCRKVPLNVNSVGAATTLLQSIDFITLLVHRCRHNYDRLRRSSVYKKYKKNLHIIQ